MSRNRKVWIVPPALLPGARIAVIAPGSQVQEAALEPGLTVLRRWGFEPVLGRYVLSGAGDLAGFDRQRAADLRWALFDRSIDAVWAARGGWGTARLLADLDVQRIARLPRWLLGFSDLSALQAVMLDHGITSLHAPVVIELADPERAPGDELAQWLRHPERSSRFELKHAAGPKRGRVDGPLAGGCLRVLATLAGTRWQPRWQQHIVFLEDVAEAPYSVDRALWQLGAAGMMTGVRALIAAQFTRCEPAAGRPSRTISEVFRDFAARWKLPLLEGLPAGHGAGAQPIPLGYHATIELRTAQLRLDPPWA